MTVIEVLPFSTTLPKIAKFQLHLEAEFVDNFWSFFCILKVPLSIIIVIGEHDDLLRSSLRCSSVFGYPSDFYSGKHFYFSDVNFVDYSLLYCKYLKGIYSSKNHC